MSKGNEHNIWHHVAMVVISEIKNILILFAGVELMIGGWVIYKFADQFFFEVAIGLPFLIIGLSLVVMKIYELFLTILDARRLKAICKFCMR